MEVLNRRSVLNWRSLLGLFLALLVFWTIFVVYWKQARACGDGRIVYVLDDTYITMAMSKNLVQHGNWGPVANEFCSCASSFLWVLAVAVPYYLLGVIGSVPLVLNLLCGSVLIVLMWTILRSHGLGPLECWIATVAIMLTVPMVPVAFTGLEHLLHACLTLAFVQAAGVALLEDLSPRKRSLALAILLGLSPLLTMTRYEGAFVVGVVSLLFLRQKKVAFAFLLGALGALPILVAGCIFMAQGSYFLPLSLIQKAKPDLATWGSTWQFVSTGISQLLANPHMIVILIVPILSIVRLGSRTMRDPLGIMSVIFLAMTMIHLQLARLGWFYRYEAYLMTVGLVLAAMEARRSLPRLAARMPGRARMLGVCLVLWLGLVWPIVKHDIEAYQRVTPAFRDIYQQQYQMARFLKTFYAGSTIAANDIGAVNFFSETKCLDMVGLGTTEVMRLIQERRWHNPTTIREVCSAHGVKVAVLYPDWFDGGRALPPEWKKVAQWQDPNNHACACNHVVFFAVDPSEEPRLRRHLEAFRSELPQGVACTWFAPPPQPAAGREAVGQAARTTDAKSL